MKRFSLAFGLALLVALAPASATPGPAAGWADAWPELQKSVRAGDPLVVHVTVPLCSNEQIHCGALSSLGRPGSLATNLYWGAIFGAKRIFSRKDLGWELVGTDTNVKGVLERAVFRRKASGDGWISKQSVEVLVVLDAYHGDKIDSALADFHARATRGGSVTFEDGGKKRTLAIDVAGYAGHNRLMDGKKLPPVPAEKERKPIPSFVLACYSEKYFSAELEKAGTKPLLLTKALMAPEGYAIEAVVRALGEGKSKKDVRDETVRAYAKWQEIPLGTAGRAFADAS